MVIWISGAYGVGKSSLASALKNKMNNALIFDAEEVGNAVRDSYPNVPYGYIFEDYTLWGEFCFKLIKDVHNKFQKDIIVPMTLVRKDSYKIIKNLRKAGIDVKFYILEASYQSIHARILARGEEEGCWCMENIEFSRREASKLNGMHINTDNISIDDIASAVLKEINK